MLNCSRIQIIFVESGVFKYYLPDLFYGNFYEVSESDFFDVVGTDRNAIPMEYDEGNINRQNFVYKGEIIACRERV